MAKVAVIQFKPEQYNPKLNLERMESFIQKASGKADIIVFPEDSVAGPLGGKLEYADSGEYLSYFQVLAQKYNISIVPGSFVVGKGGRYYNTCYYIDSKGDVLGEYQKNNLWYTEQDYITPGNQTVVFDTEFGRVGLAVCWDLSSPELFRDMARKGVQIIIVPSYWSQGRTDRSMKHDKKSEVNHVNALCEARAFENKAAIVYCNASGVFRRGDIKDRLIGRSQVTLPFKGAIKRLNNDSEKMFICEIDKNILDDAKFVYGGRHIKPDRLTVVVDTNVFVAAKFNPRSKSAQIIRECTEGKYTAIHSLQVREEVEAVVYKIRVRQDFHPIVDEFFANSRAIQTDTHLDVCRDAGDNRLLECAIDGGADFVITADRGVLEKSGFQGLRIVNASEFYRQVKS